MEILGATLCTYLLLITCYLCPIYATFCPNGQFALNAQCLDCHSTCEECTGQEPFECTECGIDEDGVERFLHRNRCKAHCPRGFYQDRDTYTCEPCPLNCELCIGANSCQKCKGNYKPQNGACNLMHCVEGM
ncbi:proprotein convertase subtilisin/kexin type 5-like [Spea bombifrons]|uniref:proprotein convertase subtilisin/kexin type 5-like n=1 Tax=Spea bombifrons TaxID=233779 RepID=UPI00234B9B12|nr:proprotein convertase subtilisin/kexin type 5-like [Spea bombifrons]